MARVFRAQLGRTRPRSTHSHPRKTPRAQQINGNRGRGGEREDEVVMRFLCVWSVLAAHASVFLPWQPACLPHCALRSSPTAKHGTSPIDTLLQPTSPWQQWSCVLVPARTPTESEGTTHSPTARLRGDDTTARPARVSVVRRQAQLDSGWFSHEQVKRSATTSVSPVADARSNPLQHSYGTNESKEVFWT